MSKDQHKGGLPEGIDEALEVRIVAWLLGEASDFERAELEAMVRDHAAVRAFHHEMKSLIGDARSAHGMDGPEEEDWKLSGDRRDKVMAGLGAVSGQAKASMGKRVDRWPGASIKRRMQWLSMAAAVTLFGFGLWALSNMMFAGGYAKLDESRMIPASMGPPADYAMERSRAEGLSDAPHRKPSPPSESSKLIAASVPSSAVYLPEVPFDTTDIDIGTSASLGKGFGGSGSGGFAGVAARRNDANEDARGATKDKGIGVDSFAENKPRQNVDAFDSRNVDVQLEINGDAHRSENNGKNGSFSGKIAVVDAPSDPFAAAPSEGEDRFAEADESHADPFAAPASEPSPQPESGERRAITAGNRSGDYPITRGELESELQGRGQVALGMSPAVTSFPASPATPTDDLVDNDFDQNGRAGRANVDVRREAINFNEYEPPELPNSVGVASGERPIAAAFPVTPATPTAFETDESGYVYPAEYDPRNGKMTVTAREDAMELVEVLTSTAGGQSDKQALALGDIPVVVRLFRSNSDAVLTDTRRGGIARDLSSESGEINGVAYNRTRSEMLAEVDTQWETTPPILGVPQNETRDGVEGDKAAWVSDENQKAQIVGDASTLDPFEEVGKDAQPAPAKKPAPQIDLDEIFLEQSAADEGVSTFSLHVNDASFKVVAALLESGQWPDAERVREEEFVNALDYGDLSPTASERIAAKVEQAAHPFLGGRNLVRIGLRTASVGRDTRMPLHLTILLDTSGSMEREDRREIVARSLASLATMLSENDVVSLVGFSRNTRLLVDRVPGSRAGELVKTAMALPAEGGTNIEAALTLAGEIAERQFNADGQNRIVMLTDGAANLGGVDAERLMAMGSQFRQMGVALDCYGVGIDGLDDTVLEALTRKSDGRYFVLDVPQQADEEFAKAVAGTLSPLALDVKVQVRFNPDRVGGYRLIGFRKQRLNEEDFRNDAVDGGEIAAAAEGNALYQVEVVPDGAGDIGEVWVRFRDARTGEMIEKQWRIPYDENAKSLADADETMKMAGLAGLFAEALLKGAEIGGEEVKELEPLARDVVARRDYDERLKEMAKAVSDAAGL